MVAEFSHNRSTRPFPILPGRIAEGVDVDQGTVPAYMIEIAYKRALAVAPDGFSAPTLKDIADRGGLDPVEFMDLIAGGDGLGTKFSTIHVLGWSPLQTQLVLKKANGDARSVKPERFVVDASAAPFPILGAKVTDGTGVDSSFVPRYMASIALRQFHKIMKARGLDVPISLDGVAKQGGYAVNAFFDLIAGGDGSGLAFMQAHANDQTAIELKLAAKQTDA